MDPAVKISQWDVDAVFKSSRFALVILNRKIEDDRKVLDLWSRAAFRVLVDGGANRFQHVLDRQKQQQDQPVPPLPDLVCGDFDSIDPDLLQHFRDVHGSHVRIVETPDQDHTDFTKALALISQSDKEHELDHVLAFVENSGRLDQIFANVQTLFHAPDHVPGKPVFLVSSQSVSWLLPAGSHVIAVPEKKRSSHVGLIPVGEPARKVTTEGLKWNLTEQELAFGKLVSTSNAFADGAKEVTVRTDKPILWTMQI